MRILPQHRIHVGRLFAFLAAGERIARDCAQRQRRLATQPHMRRFFSAQVRHETLHARLFEAVVAYLAPRSGTSTPAARNMDRFAKLLEDAARRGDLDETIIGQQLVLEGLGDVVLGRIDLGIDDRDLGFHRLRRMVRGQERAHHGFGRRWLERRTREDADLEAKLRPRALAYLELTDEILTSMQSLFDAFDEDVDRYRSSFEQSLPAGLRRMDGFDVQ